MVLQFEKQTGHKVTGDFAVIAVLKRRIEAGETFDIVIPGPELIDELVAQGKVAADTRAAFGRTGVALGVRKGAPKPDISTPENLKRALLDAKAVGHSKEGLTGVYFVEALKRLGILEEMRPKLRALAGGEDSIAMRKGELDILASGMGVIMEMPEAARALVRFMMSPAAAPTFKAKGMERD